MHYYDREGNRLKLNNLVYLNSGHCAKLYHNNEIVLKEYFPNTRNELRITQQSFDFLKTINNPHFIELYDLYCNLDFIKSLGLKVWNDFFKVDAYTSKYYSDDSVNILLENKDYLLDNLNELEKLFNILSDNNVYLDDIKRDNTILGKNGIVIIDPDLFIYNPDIKELLGEEVYSFVGSKYNLTLENKVKLLNLVNDIFTQTKYTMDNPNKGICLSLIKYFNFNINKDTNITSEISKQLHYIKQPIDYIVNKK